MTCPPVPQLTLLAVRTAKARAPDDRFISLSHCVGAAVISAPAPTNSFASVNHCLMMISSFLLSKLNL